MKNLLREYKAELIALLALLLGLFLLVEQFNIRASLYSFTVAAASTAGWGLTRGIRLAVSWARGTTPSDLIGIAVILGALVLVSWRVRWRLLRLERWQGRSCPRCGERLHRSHRHAGELVLGWTLPLRPYRCSKCGWRGLKLKE